MRLRIGLFCILLSAVQGSASTTITPTTTLAAETSNNTSAASSFQAQTNGNAAPGNVSKVPANSLLYTGASTQVYAHFMPWFGVSYHMNVGYNSADPAEVKAQVTDMLSRGISAAIIDWYGPNSTQENNSSLAVMKEAETRNGAFHFAIVVDNGALSSCANTSGCDVTQALISDINYVSQTFIPSPAYLLWNGNPVVFFFGEGSNINWSTVRANTASNLQFVFQNSGAFSNSYANAGFSWVEPETVTSSDPMALNYLSNFYSTAQKYPAKLALGASYKGFNDSLASWGTNRLVQQQCGQTWLSTFNTANNWWSTANQLPWFQVVTWNDYEEASEIETGIDNCVTINASVSGSTINWTITGSESTLDHYTVFISTDGQNLMSLGDYPTGTRSLDLSTFGFDPGTYSVFVKAVGRPSMLNHMSAAATYIAGSNGLVAQLNVTPASGIAPLNVTASTSKSTDGNGTITGSSIDFGDGTVMSGSSAGHSYANAGVYTVRATLTDSNGATASQSAQVTATAAQAPLAQLSVSPGSGTAPLAVTASTSGSTDPQGSSLTSTINFGDGTTALGPTASHTYAIAGTYSVTAVVTNAYKLQSQATASVTVSGPAAVTVSQPANNAIVASPIHVAASGIAPGGVAAMQIYLDGTLVYQVNATSFDTTVPAAAGSHRITVKLWDNSGHAYSQTLYVTVATQFTTSLSVSPTAVTAGGSISATVAATSGTMSSSQINWGDGTSSAGPIASHAYSTVGTYTVTSTATSSQGATSQATASVTVSAPAPSLTVSQPTNNASVHSPIAVSASGSASSGVNALQIYLDGALVYQVNASSFATTVSASPGSHALVVKLSDKLGNAVQQPLSVTVLPTLATSLSLSASTVAVGSSVSATVSATSGTISSSSISWGDGSSSPGPTATHTYGVAGTYTVSSTASDATGATGTATQTLTAQAASVVVLQSPSANATVPLSMHVQGYSSSPIGIVAMQIYLDGVVVYQNALTQVDTYLSVSAGSHRLTLKAWDSRGASVMKTVYVTAQ